MKTNLDKFVVVSNFGEICDLFKIEKTDQKFYFVQIVARQKDHKVKIAESSIQEYYIRSKEELLARKDEIITLCQVYGARAYINMTPKSFKDLQNNLLRDLVDETINGDVHSPRHLLKHLAGELDGKRNERVWMIDTDTDAESLAVAQWLKENGIEWNFIPTMTLGHYLTPIFDSQKFERAFPSIHLHKNSMGTLLYFEKEI